MPELGMNESPCYNSIDNLAIKSIERYGKRVGHMTTPSVKTVRIPEVELTIEQLVAAIRQLEPEARSAIAGALMETELDDRMAALLKSLSSRPPADDITDEDIQAEVKAVREQRCRAC
jgi:hypothetical protein